MFLKSTMHIAIDGKRVFGKGWGEALVFSADGECLAAATTGRLFLWQSDRVSPRVLLLPGFQNSPLSWNTSRTLIHAGGYKVDPETGGVISLPFDLLGLLSKNIDMPSACLDVDWASWNTSGDRLFFQISSVPTKDAELKDCEDLSRVWTGIADLEGRLIAPSTAMDFFEAFKIVRVASKWVAAGGPKGVQLWDANTGVASQYLETETAVCALSMDALRHRLVYITRQGAVRLWHLAENREMQGFQMDKAEVPSRCYFHPPTGLLCVCSGAQVDFWSLENAPEKVGTVQIAGNIAGLAFSETGKSLAVATGLGGTQIEVFNLNILP